ASPAAAGRSGNGRHITYQAATGRPMEIPSSVISAAVAAAAAAIAAAGPAADPAPAGAPQPPSTSVVPAAAPEQAGVLARRGTAPVTPVAPLTGAAEPDTQQPGALDGPPVAATPEPLPLQAAA
ncbi:hypothetical protein MNEG_15391, partial [Monoraphidium neglectum]